MTPLPFWLKGLYRDPFQESPGKLDLVGLMPPGLHAVRSLDLVSLRGSPWLFMMPAALEFGTASLCFYMTLWAVLLLASLRFPQSGKWICSL